MISAMPLQATQLEAGQFIGLICSREGLDELNELNNFGGIYNISIPFPRVQASVASTLIFLNKLPLKLNPVIRPIMDSIKKEEQTVIQVSIPSVILT